MKKALFISFYFPPCGSSSTARSIGFSKNLKSMGIEPIVLTADKDIYDKLPSTRIDNSFDEDLKELNIVRTKTLIPAWFINLLYRLRLSRLMRIFFPIEFHIFWLLPGTIRALRILKSQKTDFILSTSLPNTTHFIALILHLMTKIPWIADFQDPMGYRLGDVWFTIFTHKIILYLEKLICRKATGIITHSQISREILLENYPFIDENKIISITNAYDTDINKEKKITKTDRKFRIVHSGEFYGHYSDRANNKLNARKILSSSFKLFEYRNHKTDLKLHSPESLLRAVLAIIKMRPTLNNKIEIILNGYLNPQDKKLIELLNMCEIVTDTGLTSYSESLYIINSADLLYFPLYPDLMRIKHYCIPGKIFPYIASLNPILAPIQDGDSKEIIEKSGLGIFIKQYDIDDMISAIARAIDEFSKGEKIANPNISYIKQLSRAEKTKILIDFVNKVLK